MDPTPLGTVVKADAALVDELIPPAAAASASASPTAVLVPASPAYDGDEDDEPSVLPLAAEADEATVHAPASGVDSPLLLAPLSTPLADGAASAPAAQPADDSATDTHDAVKQQAESKDDSERRMLKAEAASAATLGAEHAATTPPLLPQPTPEVAQLLPAANAAHASSDAMEMSEPEVPAAPFAVHVHAPSSGPTVAMSDMPQEVPASPTAVAMDTSAASGAEATAEDTELALPVTDDLPSSQFSSPPPAAPEYGTAAYFRWYDEHIWPRVMQGVEYRMESESEKLAQMNPSEAAEYVAQAAAVAFVPADTVFTTEDPDDDQPLDQVARIVAAEVVADVAGHSSESDSASVVRAVQQVDAFKRNEKRAAKQKAHAIRRAQREAKGEEEEDATYEEPAIAAPAAASAAAASAATPASAVVAAAAAPKRKKDAATEKSRERSEAPKQKPQAKAKPKAPREKKSARPAAADAAKPPRRRGASSFRPAPELLAFGSSPAIDMYVPRSARPIDPADALDAAAEARIGAEEARRRRAKTHRRALSDSSNSSSSSSDSSSSDSVDSNATFLASQDDVYDTDSSPPPEPEAQEDSDLEERHKRPIKPKERVERVGRERAPARSGEVHRAAAAASSSARATGAPRLPRDPATADQPRRRNRSAARDGSKEPRPRRPRPDRTAAAGVPARRRAPAAHAAARPRIDILQRDDRSSRRGPSIARRTDRDDSTMAAIERRAQPQPSDDDEIDFEAPEVTAERLASQRQLPFVFLPPPLPAIVAPKRVLPPPKDLQVFVLHVHLPPSTLLLPEYVPSEFTFWTAARESAIDAAATREAMQEYADSADFISPDTTLAALSQLVVQKVWRTCGCKLELGQLVTATPFPDAPTTDVASASPPDLPAEFPVSQLFSALTTLPQTDWSALSLRADDSRRFLLPSFGQASSIARTTTQNYLQVRQGIQLCSTEVVFRHAAQSTAGMRETYECIAESVHMAPHPYVLQQLREGEREAEALQRAPSQDSQFAITAPLQPLSLRLEHPAPSFSAAALLPLVLSLRCDTGQLHTLRLCGPAFDDRCAQTLTHLLLEPRSKVPLLSAVRDVSFARSSVSAAEWGGLLSALALLPLQRLDLSDTQLGDSCLPALSTLMASKPCFELSRLDLSGCHLTGGADEEGAARTLCSSPSVTHFSFDRVPFAPGTLVHLLNLMEARDDLALLSLCDLPCMRQPFGTGAALDNLEPDPELAEPDAYLHVSFADSDSQPSESPPAALASPAQCDVLQALLEFSVAHEQPRDTDGQRSLVHLRIAGWTTARTSGEDGRETFSLAQVLWQIAGTSRNRLSRIDVRGADFAGAQDTALLNLAVQQNNEFRIGGWKPALVSHALWD